MHRDRIELAFVVNDKQYVPVVIAEHEDGSTRFVGAPDPMWKPADRIIIDGNRTGGENGNYAAACAF